MSATEGHIVKEFMIGPTRVKIADDYCRDKTPEDVEKILARIATIVRPALVAAQLRKEQEKAIT